jgi:signal transduction histidine kinase
MTDLIDSLLEFARTRESLNPALASISESVHRAVQAVRLNPRHQGTLIEIRQDSARQSTSGQTTPPGQLSSDLGSSDGARLSQIRSDVAWFDPRKLERALYNLVLNACQAAPTAAGRVLVTISRHDNSLEISIADNGPGIAEPIRDQLFHPFVSYGKENGTGLGLTVVQKIVQDHGGTVSAARSSDGFTIFTLAIPGRAAEVAVVDAGKTQAPAGSLTNDLESAHSIRNSDL